MKRTRFRRFDVVVLAVAAAVVLQAPLSVSQAAWVPHLEPVPQLALAGLVIGYVLERTRLPSTIGYLMGALFGVEAVTTVFANIAADGSFSDRVAWLGERVGTWLDTVLNGGVSNDPLVFAVAMGSLAWLIGLITAWLVFRDQAVWLALLFNAIALLMNLSYASLALVGYVGWFAFFACLLLTAGQLAQRQELWRRAQLHVNWRVPLHVLLGTAVATGALLSVAWTLPSGLTNPQVASGWTHATSPWQGLEHEFDRWFAALNGSDRTARGLNFGRTLTPRGAFDLGDTPVLQIKSAQRLYLRATTADQYAGQAITSSESTTTEAAANAELLPRDEIPAERTPIQVQIRVLASQTGVAFAPDAPLRFNVPVQVETRGSSTDIATVRLVTPLRQNQEYTVASAIPSATIQELRAAGEDYPTWVRQRYLQLPRRLPRRVINAAHAATAGATSAYDKAAALEDYFRNTFTYSTHVPVPPPDRDWVDYFLFDSKQGYCDYLATAMVVLLRVEGVPARVASGFAPGDFDPSSGVTTVRENHAHTWVEAYFPRYGWVTFEPSAIRAVPQRFEESESAATVTQTPQPETDTANNLTPDELDELRALREANANPSPSTPLFSTWPGVLLLSFAVLLVISGLAAGGLALAWRHGLSSLAHYQRPYAQLLRLGRWLGAVRSRPADTPYEIADTLAQQVPAVEPAIRELTDAYVEGTYSSRAPATDPWPAWLASRRQLIRELLRQRFRRR